MLTEYETTMVLRPDVGGESIEQILEKVRTAVQGVGGKLLEIQHWGKKKLPYDIAKHARGIFVRTHYLGSNTLVSELERHLRLSDIVLRFMTICLARNVDSATREVKAYVPPVYDAESQDQTSDHELEGDLDNDLLVDGDGDLDGHDEGHGLDEDEEQI